MEPTLPPEYQSFLTVAMAICNPIILLLVPVVQKWLDNETQLRAIATILAFVGSFVVAKAGHYPVDLMAIVTVGGLIVAGTSITKLLGVQGVANKAVGVVTNGAPKT